MMTVTGLIDIFAPCRLTGGGLAAAVEWYGFVLSERRFRLWFSKENDQSFHFALTGPRFAAGTSVSYSRLLGSEVKLLTIACLSREERVYPMVRCSKARISFDSRSPVRMSYSN